MSKKLDKMIEEVEKERPLTPEDVFGASSPIAQQIVADVIDENMNKIGSDVVGVEKCECDNTHEQNDTVCQFCWSKGRRKWNDPNPE